MNIREMTTSEDLNKEVRVLMTQFWETYDKLFIEMDTLTENQFFQRQHEMWKLRSKASEISGDIFLISLWGMDEKANLLYGKNSSNRYIDWMLDQ